MRDDMSGAFSEAFKIDLPFEILFIVFYLIIFVLIFMISQLVFFRIRGIRGFQSTLYRDIRISTIMPLLKIPKTETEINALFKNCLTLFEQNYPVDELIIITSSPFTLPENQFQSKIKNLVINEVPEKWEKIQYFRYKATIETTGNYLLFISGDCSFAKEGLTQFINYYQEEPKDTILAIIPTPVGLKISTSAEIAALFTVSLSNSTEGMRKLGFRSNLTESVILCRKKSYIRAGTHRSFKRASFQGSYLSRDFDAINIKVETRAGYPLLFREKNRASIAEYSAILKGNYKGIFNRRPYSAAFITWLWSSFTLGTFILAITAFSMLYIPTGIATSTIYLLLILEYLLATKATGKTYWLSALLFPIALPLFWIRAVLINR